MKHKIINNRKSIYNFKTTVAHEQRKHIWKESYIFMIHVTEKFYLP